MSERARLSDLKRAAILAAAVAEFDAQGFESTSMDSVAARAGVSKRTVYNHFVSKEQLFRQIRDDLVRRACDVQPVLYDAQVPLQQQLRQIGQHEVELLVSKDFACLARVTLPAALTCPKFAAEMFADVYGRQQRIVRWIEAATEDRRLQVPCPARAARQFIVLLNGFAFWPHVFGGQPVPSPAQCEQIVEETVQLFLDHYGADHYAATRP